MVKYMPFSHSVNLAINLALFTVSLPTGKCICLHMLEQEFWQQSSHAGKFLVTWSSTCKILLVSCILNKCVKLSLPCGFSPFLSSCPLV